MTVSPEPEAGITRLAITSPNNIKSGDIITGEMAQELFADAAMYIEGEDFLAEATDGDTITVLDLVVDMDTYQGEDIEVSKVGHCTVIITEFVIQGISPGTAGGTTQITISRQPETGCSYYIDDDGANAYNIGATINPSNYISWDGASEISAGQFNLFGNTALYETNANNVIVNRVLFTIDKTSFSKFEESDLQALTKQQIYNIAFAFGYQGISMSMTKDQMVDRFLVDQEEE